MRGNRATRSLCLPPHPVLADLANHRRVVEALPQAPTLIQRRGHRTRVQRTHGSWFCGLLCDNILGGFGKEVPALTASLLSEHLAASDAHVRAAEVDHEGPLRKLTLEMAKGRQYPDFDRPWQGAARG